MSCFIMICKLAVVLFCTLVGVYADDDLQPPTAAGPRIVGGYKVADRSQFPYQVSLRRDNKHFCGGTVLDEQHVLTAAHCVFEQGTTNLIPIKSLTVVAGDLKLSTPTSYTVKTSVKHVFTHSKYDPGTVANDIAVLRIKETFKPWSSNLQPLPLADAVPADWTPCRISGWGTQRYEDPYILPDLYAADIKIFPDNLCKSAYGNQIKSGMFCAGLLQGGKDSCQGDSGGPLEVNNRLVGIVSWGAECAKAGAPGVYTDVSKYLPWVSEQQSRSSSGTYMLSTLSIISAMILHLLRV